MMEYSGPLSIGSAFECDLDVGFFVETMVDEVQKLSENKDQDFIPPIVYSAQGRAFNVHYNFMINCLAKLHHEQRIKSDFALEDGTTGFAIKNGMFLVTAVLEDYYGIVRANNYTINLSKYKSNKSIEIKRRFYNVVVYKNGENLRRFSAVPFSESVIKKILKPDMFLTLESVSKIENIEQIVFGNGPFNQFVIDNKMSPEYVNF